MQLELYSCLESVLGSLTWEGAPTWRGVVVSRDVERHFGARVEAARQVPFRSTACAVSTNTIYGLMADVTLIL